MPRRRPERWESEIAPLFQKKGGSAAAFLFVYKDCPFTQAAVSCRETPATRDACRPHDVCNPNGLAPSTHPLQVRDYRVSCMPFLAIDLHGQNHI